MQRTQSKALVRRILVVLSALGILSMATMVKPSPASAQLQPAIVTPAGYFKPEVPRRILDTRSGEGMSERAHPVFGGQTITVDAHVPPGTMAVVVNVTATNVLADGYLTVWSDLTDQPQTSSLSVNAGQTVANLMTVSVRDGRFHIFAYSTMDVAADVTGLYAPATNGESIGGRIQLIEPTRVVDSRIGTGVRKGLVFPGRSDRLTMHLKDREDLHLPSDVGTAILSVTITETSDANYATVYPATAATPPTSNVNADHAGQIVANMVIIGVDGNGDVALEVYHPTHIVVDVMGYFNDGSENELSSKGTFIPLSPVRAADTREGDMGGRLESRDEHYVDVGKLPGVSDEAVGVLLNVTATNVQAAGYLTLYPYDVYPPPKTSNLNFPANPGYPRNPGSVAVAVAVGVQAGDGRVRFRVQSYGDVDAVVDLTGWYQQ